MYFSSSSSKQQQQQQAIKKIWGDTETGIQVAQNDSIANAHHLKQVLCDFELSSLFSGSFQPSRDDHPKKQ